MPTEHRRTKSPADQARRKRHNSDTRSPTRMAGPKGAGPTPQRVLGNPLGQRKATGRLAARSHNWTRPAIGAPVDPADWTDNRNGRPGAGRQAAGPGAVNANLTQAGVPTGRPTIAARTRGLNGIKSLQANLRRHRLTSLPKGLRTGRSSSRTQPNARRRPVRISRMTRR